MGSRRAINAASNARYQRLEEKTERSAGLVVGLWRFARNIIAKFIPAYTPEKPSKNFIVEVK